MNIQEFNPKNDPVGKFSPNLFKFLEKNKTKGYNGVFRCHDGILWVGCIDEGDFFGAKLIQTLCNGAKTDTYYYSKLGAQLERVEFWPEYKRIGRCAIDKEHTMSFVSENKNNRWEVSDDGKKRTCRWCGEVTQILEEYVFSEVRTRWIPA